MKWDSEHGSVSDKSTVWNWKRRLFCFCFPLDGSIVSVYHSTNDITESSPPLFWVCVQAWAWNITQTKKKEDCNNEEDSVSELLKWIFHLYQPCPLTPGGTFLLGWGGVVLWVWCRDCRKAQEMNVLSAHAKKTRLQRGRRNKYLNLTHLLLPSQTAQAADGFLSSNKTRFSSAWWGLPLLSRFHIWCLEWEYSAWLVETVGLRLWCLRSRAPLRLCSTGAEQHILLTQWKTERGRRWRSASVGRLQCPVQQQNLEHEKGSVCSRFAVQCESVKQASLPLRKFRSEELLGGSEQHHGPDRHIESALWVEDWPSHLFPFQSNSILKPEPQDPL